MMNVQTALLDFFTLGYIKKRFTVYWISFKCINLRSFISSPDVLKVLPLFKVFVGKTFAIHLKNPRKLQCFFS